MNHQILYSPSFAVARVMLDPGQSVRAESGAMVSMSPTVEVRSNIHGGIGKALGRIFGGESIFQTTFIAETHPGEVILAPSGPGDIIVTEPAAGLMVTSGCFLACDPQIELTTHASARNFFSGEGLFLMQATGPGHMLLSSFGAIHSIELAPGQPYVVDTGHLVAFSSGMGYEIRTAAKGWLGSFTSGEGVVVRLTGPGFVHIQTRTPSAFASLLGPHLPNRG